MSGRRFIVDESALYAFIKRVARPNMDPGKLTQTFLAGNGALVTKVVEADRSAVSGASATMPTHYHEWEDKVVRVHPDAPGHKVTSCRTCGVVR